MSELTGKTALITGGGTGIGKSIAKIFHDEGAYVIICGRRSEKLDQACREISPGNDKISRIAADISSEKAVKELVEKASKITGKLDIIVNNAGIMRFGSLHETPLSDWDSMISTNVFGPWRIMVHTLPYLKASGGGSIINISSIAGIKAFPGAGIYCMTKSALQTISQVMAMETASDNIRVNCILPGLVEDTELSDPIFGSAGVRDFWEKMKPLHPLNRNGKPKDIAEAALFFASERSSWITGMLLSVDGGRHLATNRKVS